MIASLPSVRRLLVLLVLGTILVIPATAGASTFPDTIRLPDGWQPEGIATGRGTSFYVGSLRDGSIYKGDLATGAGAVLVAGAPGRVAVGIEVDRRNRLFVAGGPSGAAAVYDARTGAVLASYQPLPAGTGWWSRSRTVCGRVGPAPGSSTPLAGQPWFPEARTARPR